MTKPLQSISSQSDDYNFNYTPQEPLCSEQTQQCYSNPEAMHADVKRFFQEKLRSSVESSPRQARLFSSNLTPTNPSRSATFVKVLPAGCGSGQMEYCSILTPDRFAELSKIDDSEPFKTELGQRYCALDNPSGGHQISFTDSTGKAFDTLRLGRGLITGEIIDIVTIQNATTVDGKPADKLFVLRQNYLGDEQGKTLYLKDGITPIRAPATLQVYVLYKDDKNQSLIRELFLKTESNIKICNNDNTFDHTNVKALNGVYFATSMWVEDGKLKIFAPSESVERREGSVRDIGPTRGAKDVYGVSLVTVDPNTLQFSRDPQEYCTTLSFRK